MRARDWRALAPGRGARWRALALGVALMGVVVGSAHAATALPCAEWISSSEDDAPLTGHLRGSETRTVSLEVDAEFIGGTVSIQYDVGYYEMSDGSTLKIDCRTYTVVAV